jgi:hypothetical protein
MSEPVSGTITRAMRDGVLDAELAGLLWLLLDGGLPLVISGAAGSGRSRLLQALAELTQSAEASQGGGRREPLLLEAATLEEIFDSRSAATSGQVPDELRQLGLVLIVRRVEGRGSRLVSAHYVRPVERDAAGHLQRRPPAILSAWDERRDVLEHFYWGVTTELAERVGTTMRDFEAARVQRTDFLAGLLSAGVLEGEAVRRAIDGFALSSDLAGKRAGSRAAGERH